MIVTITLFSLVDELTGDGQLVDAIVVNGGIVCQPPILRECVKKDQSLPPTSRPDDLILLRGYR